DIFAYFSNLAEHGQLPPLEELEWAAQKLHRAYSTTRALHRALGDVHHPSIWSQSIPEGSAWPRDTSSPGIDHGADYVLACSISFMRDTLISCKAAYATAEGDVGRLFETMKHMLFTFAGSTHSKYVTYLLEFITTLELEDTSSLRDTTLRSLLVNLTGEAGSFTAVDFLQEHLNRLLEAIVERKGVEYGADYICTVISRNLHHFACIKTEFGRDGVGLSQRSGRHKTPHQRPEIRILLAEYQAQQLHYR
ncbi:hypothetical protein DFH29DRAFT_801665, partial [Suillus ampliporus]